MKIILILLLIANPAVASEWDWLVEQQRREYLDGNITRNNERLKRDTSKEDALTEEVRDINEFNLYINSKDYQGETIVIPKEGYNYDKLY